MYSCARSRRSTWFSGSPNSYQKTWNFFSVFAPIPIQYDLNTMTSNLAKPDKYHHLVVSLLLIQNWPQLERFHFFVNGQTRFTTNIFNARVASEDSRFIQLRVWAASRATSFSKARLRSHTRVGHRSSTLHFGMFSFDRVCFFFKFIP